MRVLQPESREAHFRIAVRHVVAVVGDTAFVHGGIVPGMAAGLDDATVQIAGQAIALEVREETIQVRDAA